MKPRALLAVLAAVFGLEPALSFSQENDPALDFFDHRLAVWANAQVLGQFVEGDSDLAIDARSEGWLRRVQLGAVGKPWDWLELGLAVEYNGFDPVAQDGDSARFYVPEAYLEFLLPYTVRIKAGHFTPPWTNEMPKRGHELDFIRYPLIVDSGQLLFTPWRQTGALVSVTPGENLQIALGFFHGLDLPDAYLDDNNMFDTMVMGSFGLFPGFRFKLGYWGGRSELRTETVEPGEFEEMPFGLSTVNAGATPIEVGGGVVDNSNVWVGLDLAAGGWRFSAEALWNEAQRDGNPLQDMRGYDLSAIYSHDWFSAMLRYEQLDPDTADRGGGDDEREWTTLGLAAEPFDWLRCTANYIVKSERGANQIDNNEFLIQATLKI